MIFSANLNLPPK